MKKTKFYICNRCRNTVEMLYDSDIKLYCCGDQMSELVPNTVEASGEKHLPTVKIQGNTVEVNVGSVDHPMEEAHRIDWVQLVTDQGSYRKWLKPGDAPHVNFLLNGEKPIAVYAFCNLHGLWKTEL